MNGLSVPSWAAYTNITTPPFANAGDDAIVEEIWRNVAAAYARWDIDVTTENTPVQKAVVGVVAIGGNWSDWYGVSAGGVTLIDSYFHIDTPNYPGVAFVFANDLGNVTQYVYRGAMHEAGHGFALYHQSVWVDGVLTQEYNPGTADFCPIMGLDYYATRVGWIIGTPDYSDVLLQDDAQHIGFVAALAPANPRAPFVSPVDSNVGLFC